MDSSSRQGLNSYPNVVRSESERMPGYRNRSQVPPEAPRPSRMTKLFCGSVLVR